MPAYLSGFGNEHATEAVPGALPVGQNSPQRPLLGLYAEQISGTPFTVPRHEARRVWMYRIRPSAQHRPYRRIANGLPVVPWRSRPRTGCGGTPCPSPTSQPISWLVW